MFNKQLNLDPRSSAEVIMPIPLFSERLGISPIGPVAECAGRFNANNPEGSEIAPFISAAEQSRIAQKKRKDVVSVYGRNQPAPLVIEDINDRSREVLQNAYTTYLPKELVAAKRLAPWWTQEVEKIKKGTVRIKAAIFFSKAVAGKNNVADNEVVAANSDSTPASEAPPVSRYAARSWYQTTPSDHIVPSIEEAAELEVGARNVLAELVNKRSAVANNVKVRNQPQKKPLSAFPASSKAEEPKKLNFFDENGDWVEPKLDKDVDKLHGFGGMRPDLNNLHGKVTTSMKPSSKYSKLSYPKIKEPKRVDSVITAAEPIKAGRKRKVCDNDEEQDDDYETAKLSRARNFHLRATQATYGPSVIRRPKGRSSAPKASKMIMKKPKIQQKDENCQICQGDQTEDNLLYLCDGCDSHWHESCAGIEIPKGDILWFCVDCEGTPAAIASLAALQTQSKSAKWSLLEYLDELKALDEADGVPETEGLEDEKLSQATTAVGSDTIVISDDIRVCEVCHEDKNDAVALECEKCRKLYHTYCINMDGIDPKTDLPDDWTCDACPKQRRKKVASERNTKAVQTAQKSRKRKAEDDSEAVRPRRKRGKTAPPESLEAASEPQKRGKSVQPPSLQTAPTTRQRGKSAQPGTVKAGPVNGKRKAEAMDSIEEEADRPVRKRARSARLKSAPISQSVSVITTTNAPAVMSTAAASALAATGKPMAAPTSARKRKREADGGDMAHGPLVALPVEDFAEEPRSKKQKIEEPGQKYSARLATKTGRAASAPPHLLKQPGKKINTSLTVPATSAASSSTSTSAAAQPKRKKGK